MRRTAYFVRRYILRAFCVAFILQTLNGLSWTVLNIPYSDATPPRRIHQHAACLLYARLQHAFAALRLLACSFRFSAFCRLASQHSNAYIYLPFLTIARLYRAPRTFFFSRNLLPRRVLTCCLPCNHGVAGTLA